MGIQPALTRILLNWLPVDKQERMAADVVAWLCADLPAAERQEKIEKLGPRLLKRIRAGQFGLRLVIYYHLFGLTMTYQEQLVQDAEIDRARKDSAAGDRSWLARLSGALRG